MYPIIPMKHYILKYATWHTKINVSHKEIIKRAVDLYEKASLFDHLVK
jgi:hypothetical protein